MTCDDDREEMRNDKIRAYMEDDARTRVEENHGVRFEYYDGYLEEVDIVDIDNFLGWHESELLEKLQDDEDEDIEMILAYCWLERKKARLAELDKKTKEEGGTPRLVKIESIVIERSHGEFLEELIIGD